MIDKSKIYRTRDGREVRIYATDGGGPYSIHGALKSSCEDVWYPYNWLADGKHRCDHILDLIEVRPRIKRTVWLNVFKDTVVATDEKPDHKITSLLACVKVEIDCEEGTGL